MFGLSTDLVWNVLYFVLIFAVPRRKIYRGKLFTMPLRRLLRVKDRRPDFPGMFFRLTQIMACDISCTCFLSGPIANTIEWLVACSLFLDDYLTGDDDEWKRFKDWARNKVKWKMELPEPIADRVAS